MFRSAQHDMIHRDKMDEWMDLAVVDSLPFLYFLQYKVYRHLQRYQEQQQALSKLENIIKTDQNLGHKETALNVLGQCMEQENRPKQALKCYLLSLRQRARNNVARIHICRLLFSLLVGKNKYDKNTGECIQNEIYLYLRC
jgi:tetratricopeptide (TPR) repeat protein